MTVRRNIKDVERIAAGQRLPALEPAPVERRVDLLDHMTDSARADFEAAATIRKVPAGDRIYTQDDQQRVMFRIISGRVWLSYARMDGRELLYLLLGRGECLGISSLIDGDGVPQSATARSDVTLQVLDKATLDRLRQKHRSLDDAIMHSMLRDIRILISHLSEAALDDLPARVARRLLSLARARGGDYVVDLPQSELAAMFGVSRQTLNKILKQFEERGLVKLAYAQVRLQDVDSLRDTATPT